MSEGIAKHVEAMALDCESNHKASTEFLKQQAIFPLEELVEHNIGMPGMKTTVGYPVSGSFCGFLIEKYGMKRFKDAYVLESRSREEREKEDSWRKTFDRTLEDLEKEWLFWLAQRYHVNNDVLNEHFQRMKERNAVRKEAEAQKPRPEEWPLYVGIYEWREMGRTFEIRMENDKLVMTSADMPDLKIILIPAMKNGFRMRGGPMEGQMLIFEVNAEGRVWNANLGALSFIRK
jgi:hypothetical protein